MSRSHRQDRSSGDIPRQQYSSYARSDFYGSDRASYSRSQSPQQYGQSVYSSSYLQFGNPSSVETPAINRHSRSSGVYYDPQVTFSNKRGRILPVLVAAVVFLLLGFGAGFFLFGSQPHTLKPTPAVLSSNDLGVTVGYYSVDGNAYPITAQEAITSAVSLESMRVSVGYTAPTADMIIAYARNQILKSVALSRGISVSSHEVDAYAVEYFGTSDYAYLGSYLNMTADQAYTAVSEAATVRKLRDSVLGSVSGAPIPPVAPSDGNGEVGTAYYADYIIGLLGSHWDAASKTWANTSNPFYAPLSSMVFAPGSASYDAAQVAYGIAFEQSTGFSLAEAWARFVNDALADSSISIATLSV